MASPKSEASTQNTMHPLFVMAARSFRSQRMNHRPIARWRLLGFSSGSSGWLVLFWLLGVHLGWCELIYDNSQSTRRAYYCPGKMTNEHGDEISLAGTGRILTTFTVEYFGDFVDVAGKTARIRFYANDGPADAGWSNCTPKTLLYQSEPLQLFPGYNSLALNELGVRVPEHFTWTVQYAGLKGGYSNRVGLVLYDKPTVGDSYDDFWENKTNGWKLYQFNRMLANFGARVKAIPDTPLQLRSLKRVADDQCEVMLEGPAYKTVWLQSSPDLEQWTNVAQFTLLGNPIACRDQLNSEGGTNHYRVVESTNSIRRMKMESVNEYGDLTMELSGKPGTPFLLQWSRNFRSWSIVYRDYFLAPNLTWVMNGPPPDPTAGYFRYRVDAQNRIVLDPTQWSSNQRTYIAVGGPKGWDCVFQTSTNLVDWSPLLTTIFSCTDGRACCMTPTNQPLQFYRVQAFAP